MTDTNLPRLRQAVVAATELEPVANQLTQALSLREPYNDPGVSYFGLRNAVFAIGDQFLEIVSPAQDGTAAGRLIARRGGDCGYMLMFQVADLEAARSRAAERNIREVFEVELDDIAEVHLHPADMDGAIVALSTPRPPETWRWGGEGWNERAAAGSVTGVTVAVADPDATGERWRHVIGDTPGVRFVRNETADGPVEIEVTGSALAEPATIAGVRFSPA
jgi:Glyoxalase-like domain